MKYLKIIGIVVGVIAVLAVVFSLLVKYHFINQTFTWKGVVVTGRSMNELGFNDGDYVKAYFKDCQIGDVCVLDCLSEKCRERMLIKQVKKKENGCYWFEGNPSGKYTNDSRRYGWLCDNELKIIGVVK